MAVCSPLSPAAAEEEHSPLSLLQGLESNPTTQLKINHSRVMWATSSTTASVESTGNLPQKEASAPPVHCRRGCSLDLLGLEEMIAIVCEIMWSTKFRGVAMLHMVLQYGLHDRHTVWTCTQIIIFHFSTDSVRNGCSLPKPSPTAANANYELLL